MGTFVENIVYYRNTMRIAAATLFIIAHGSGCSVIFCVRKLTLPHYNYWV